MKERRDYFVKDEFGVIWNDEALPTFGQAYDFRGAIKPCLNRPLTLIIVSTVRISQVVEVLVKPVSQIKLHTESEF
jgi:hypothetical protein